MTPEARIQAAIGVLDRILAGEPAERTLTNWARASRFAGSGDRAAIRDHVFDALRCLRSFTALSGAAEPSGRAAMIGALRAHGRNPDDIFTGQGHAPSPLTPEERNALAAAPALDALPRNVALDCPDWIAPHLRRALQEDFAPVLRAMRERAPVFLRVNAAKADVGTAIAALAADGIVAAPDPAVSHALRVIEGARRITGGHAYRDGVVELQDLSPQAAVQDLPLGDGMRVLDYCAGGGGKSLAMAARARIDIVAHDIARQRMRDLPERARRAGANIRLAQPGKPIGKDFDLVLADVPCSGTGTWRRTPDAKWRLTESRLGELLQTQSLILDRAADLVAPKGWLAYMTCSLVDLENGDQVRAFLSRHRGWTLGKERLFTPLSAGDGFYMALLTREA
ncbi:16S rRNA (cytosine967-C5)-methyltransferase [Albidovulum inexpectatum]|uniref:16S rRNA (Cytosine967-C5)-methyltransferase n=1 Tax=Albidovulum inexpectatum TaxID=196587 RepID=A0A2S5JJ17_9RHOB|nr:RsmB/NOP family class I SAM-dependent RNA methyltransferase [Albidovulum inexpectatum]PPB81245.1 16S rRNA (cytosine967-C5)-methyltransferase [Albidovulum inexpectatum]